MPSYVVVGASRGIGLELVRQLAVDPNNKVFATARNKNTATHLNSLLEQLSHQNVYVLETDVVDYSTLQTAADEAAKATGGTLDVLIYNAARLDRENMLRGLLDYPSEEKLHSDFIEAYEVNVLGGIHSVNAFLPLLRKGATKKIVFMGGDASSREFVEKTKMAEMASLSITKAAQSMVSLKYAVQLKDEGFTVVIGKPGWVDTSGTAPNSGDTVSDEDKAKLGKMFGNLKAVYPNAAPQTPDVAVRKLLETIHNASPKDNGSYLQGPK